MRKENCRNGSQSFVQLTSIQVGGSICLPVILVGHILCEKHGLGAALGAVAAGNLLLLGLGSVAASMSADGWKSTPEYAADYFGEQGARLFALLMIICLLGWFGIQLNMMNLILPELIHPWASTAILGALITFMVSRGLGAMSWLANVSIPILLLILGYAVFQAPIPVESAFQDSEKWTKGISLVMAASIAAIVDLPNFFRYARTKRDGMITNAIVYGFAMPLIEGVGIYLSAALPEAPLLDALHGQQGLFWSFGAGGFLLLGSWITNNTNLFSATVTSEMVAPGLSPILRTIGLGVMGTIIACGNPVDHLEVVLDTIGMGVSSMGGVLLTGFLIKHKTASHTRNLCSWVLGTAVGFSAPFTGVSILDAFAAAGISTIFMNINFKEKLWNSLQKAISQDSL